MKKLKIIMIIAIIMIIGTILFMSGNKEKKVIGIWETADNTASRFFYEGGTGKWSLKSGSNGSFSWEYKKDILTITYSPSSIKGYKIKNNTMTSLDREETYYKSK